MNLTILSPTIFESAAILNFLEHNFTLESGIYKKGDLHVSLVISGVGLVNTAIQTTKIMTQDSDLLILVGLAGALNKSYTLGDIVNVTTERFADLGAEDQDGSLLSVHDLDLIPANQFPFIDGALVNEGASEFNFLPKASSLSVNKVTGSQDSIDLLQKKYQADIENMEGAAFFQVCKMYRKKFLQLRAISNYVEPRNRDSWQIELALENLSKVVVSILEGLSGSTSS